MATKDIAGERYGKLTAIKLASKNPTMWECVCDCGVIKNVRLCSLTTGNTKSCGCSQFKTGARVDIVGKRYSKLTVIEELKIHDMSKKEHIKYKCLCDCGNETIVNGVDLNSKKVMSCGCNRIGCREA